MQRRALYLLAGALLFSGPCTAAGQAPPAKSLTDLGRELFFDPGLSRDGTMSCSTCHDPARAFTDPRDNGSGGSASLGNDGVSLGDRNAPTVTYAAFVPPFASGEDGTYTGGLFHDGRAGNLAAQAAQPILSPKEMALPDAAAVLARVRANPSYVAAFDALLGASSLATPAAALDAVAAALAAYEASPEVSTFDSKYDRFLRGEATLTRDEELGRILFFSPLSNCNRCHLLDRRENQPRELFSNFEYHNIGVPVNEALRRSNGSPPGFADVGLAANPGVTGSGHEGKVRVPGLRNVAVTAPYMHNGVFADLRTTILFYNRFLVDNDESRTNPETGEPWGSAEIPGTVARELLGEGQPLTGERVRQLEAFLETLTDRRYEHLLQR